MQRSVRAGPRKSVRRKPSAAQRLPAAASPRVAGRPGSCRV